MLKRSGLFDEEELIEALKQYLPLYGVKEKEICEIPYEDGDLKKVMVAKFQWMIGQWVYLESYIRT